MDTVACSCVGLHLVFFFQVFFLATFQFQFGQFAAFRLASTDKSRTQPRRNGCVNALLASLGRLSGDISNNQRQKSFVSSREVAGNGLLGYDA